MPGFSKSPPALVERFESITAEYPGAQRRPTFGYPCLYVGGNMVSGLFQSSWHVRRGAAETAELVAIEGSAPFEPMPGRPMTGFTLLAPSIVEDDVAIRRWVERAIAFGVTMPPKVAKPKKAAASKGA